MKSIHDNILVSVVIPVYNGKTYLGACLNSIQMQSYRNIEIIVVDDGSTDCSLDIIKARALEDDRIRYFSIPNSGQGFARNRAVEIARGEYILFVDADDMIEPMTIEVLLERALHDNADLVAFAYKYFKQNQRGWLGKVERYYGVKTVEGVDKLTLLDRRAYYPVTQLYKKTLLNEFKIVFGEGHLYEDKVFYLKAVLKAHRVSIVHSPLYRVRISPSSSTRSGLNTDRHFKGYLLAVQECVNLLNMEGQLEGIENARYYYVRYAVRKFMQYYYARVPKELRANFSKSFVSILNTIGPFSVLNENDKLISTCLRMGVFSQKRVYLFRLLTFYMMHIRPKRKRIRARCHRSLIKVKKLVEKNKDISIRESYSSDMNIANYQAYSIVLFMGFDFRYTGNSRYLFESMVRNQHSDVIIFFATNDSILDNAFRVKPNSPRYFEIYRQAKVIVFESWIPNKLKKQPGTIWIQLWHGNPIKRLLFDSNESEIFAKNQNSKDIHYKDLVRWDFLVVESRFFSKLFQSAFHIAANRMIISPYPRVQYLLEHAKDDSYRKELIEQFELTINKKKVLYLPTWRDYNYGVERNEYDQDYLLDCDRIQKKLGNEFEVISKGHIYLNESAQIDTSDSITKVISPDCETQELLLVSDFVITDYSSVVFDAFAAEKKVLLYCNDLDKYQSSRGVYASVWRYLEPFVCLDEETLCDRIISYPSELEKAARSVRELRADNLAFNNDIESTIIHYANDRMQLRRMVLFADDARDAVILNEKINELFSPSNANSIIVVYPSNSREAEVLRCFARQIAVVSYACDNFNDLTVLFNEFWIGGVICFSDVLWYEEIESICMSNNCTLYNIDQESGIIKTI